MPMTRRRALVGLRMARPVYHVFRRAIQHYLAYGTGSCRRGVERPFGSLVRTNEWLDALVFQRSERDARLGVGEVAQRELVGEQREIGLEPGHQLVELLALAVGGDATEGGQIPETE